MVRTMAHLFVLELTYVGSLEEVDKLMSRHREYLRRYYETGAFLGDR